MACAYPGARDRIITVMNGYDGDPLPKAESGSAFTIGYAGSLYYERDPRPLLRGAARVIRELSLAPSDLQIRFVGDVSHFGGVPLSDLGHDAGVSAFMDISDRVPHSDVAHFLASCHMLVSLPWDVRLTVPAKLFEYVRHPAWLLIFGEPGSAVERLFHGCDVDVVRRGDVDGTAAAIKRRFLQFQHGERATPLSTERRLSRQAQAEILLEAMQRATQEGLPAGTPH
jgi:hypothetical protein